MQTQIKVRGYHLDVYQHVNNARYLEFLEEARWDGLENSPAFQWMMEKNIAFVVVNININYRRPEVLCPKPGGHPQPQWRSSGRCADYLRLYRFENPEGAAAGRGIACKT